MFRNAHCWNKIPKTIDLKPACLYLCLLWGMYIYSDKLTFITLLTIDKEMSLYLTTIIQFRSHECTSKAVAWNC